MEIIILTWAPHRTNSFRQSLCRLMQAPIAEILHQPGPGGHRKGVTRWAGKKTNGRFGAFLDMLLVQIVDDVNCVCIDTPTIPLHVMVRTVGQAEYAYIHPRAPI